MNTRAPETLAERLCADLALGGHWTSDWHEISQTRITEFADVTDDHQFIHLDPERAARETPFGGTIAHGFLTLSLASALAYEALPELEGQTAGINYGFDRIRFLAPVPAGARIRGQFERTGVKPKGEAAVLLTHSLIIEIEGRDTPALSAEWITLHQFRP
jgi:acyl dehydratase